MPPRGGPEAFTVPSEKRRMAAALPLAALFIVCFVAPLMVLVGVERVCRAGHADAVVGAAIHEILRRRLQPRHSLLLGVKATLVRLNLPDRVDLRARAGALAKRPRISLVDLPILTSVVVRTFSWIVISAAKASSTTCCATCT